MCRCTRGIVINTVLYTVCSVHSTWYMRTTATAGRDEYSRRRGLGATCTITSSGAALAAVAHGAELAQTTHDRLPSRVATGGKRFACTQSVATSMRAPIHTTKGRRRDRQNGGKHFSQVHAARLSLAVKMQESRHAVRVCRCFCTHILVVRAHA
jgi:hypothetical protein